METAAVGGSPPFAISPAELTPKGLMMTSRFRTCLAVSACLILSAALAGRLHPADTPSSKSKGKSKAGGTSLKALEARVEKLESTMLREIVDVSNSFEDAGQFDRAKSLLEVLLKLNPEFPGLKEKVQRLEEKLFDSQEIEFVLDTSKGWVPVGGAVAGGQPVRVEVEGEYKFNVTASVTADGFPSGDVKTDFVEGVPCGALIAMVVSRAGKPGRPIALKSKNTWTPSEEGLLMLKVNAPSGHKCTGKLTVKLSGLVRAD